MADRGIWKRSGALGVALVAGLLSGCGDSSGPFTVVTFNTGLARGFVDLAEQRAPQIGERLDALDIDVACLQEVWDDAEIEAVQMPVQERLSAHVFRSPQQSFVGGGEGAVAPCPPADADAILACVAANCEGIPDDELPNCVLGSCGTEFSASSAECQSCLAATAGMSLASIVSTCAAAGVQPEFSAGGAFGVHIFARGQILEQDSLLLPSVATRRSVVYSHVLVPDAGPLHVFCTQLSADLPNLQYPVAGGSWAKEQAVQIDRMLEYVERTVLDDAPVLIMGNLNTGPPLAGADGELVDNFAKLLGAGYRSPYLDQGLTDCTYCEENPLHDGVFGNVAIDHVLVRGWSGGASAERVFTAPVTVEDGEDTVETSLSDHYGIKATLD